MRTAILLVAALGLAACGEAPQTPAAGEAADSGETAQLALQPIGSPEFVANNISMKGCAFVPDGGGLGALFVTDGDKAYIKTNDSVAPLMKIGESYEGGGYSVSLAQSGEGKTDKARITRAAHLTITDGRGVKVYDTDGKAECAA